MKLFTSRERSIYGSNSFVEQQQVTRALLKFCEDHGYTVDSIQDIRACLTALEKGEHSNAIAAFKRVPIGGMGCFNDWCPAAAGPLETDDYSCAVFEALVERWCRLMSSL